MTRLPLLLVVLWALNIEYLAARANARLRTEFNVHHTCYSPSKAIHTPALCGPTPATPSETLYGFISKVFNTPPKSSTFLAKTLVHRWPFG